jgi:endo-1,4-beta-xylanase
MKTVSTNLARSWMISRLLAFVFLFSLSFLHTHAQIANGKPKFLGNVIGNSGIPSNFSTYWNQISPENAGKWESVEGTRDQMNFTQLKAAYDYAKAPSRNYPFKQHTLIWGSQFPGWMNGLSPADQKTEIIQWYTALAQNFPNLDYIDVVNEPIKTSLPFKDALGGNGTTGWDWVIEAFRLARQHFPNAKLLINEYGTENDPPVRAQYIQIINLLKAKGYIDGIGIQAHHFNVDFMKGPDVTRALDDYAATGLPVYVSELDIMGPNDNATEANQLIQYQEIFPAIWNHPNVKGVTLWGYIVGQTWRDGTGIVNADGTERSAMTWLKSFVSGSTTNTLTVSPPTLSVASAAGSSTVTVTSNTSWTVSDDQTWITTSATSGSNNGSFTVSVAANTGTTNRTGTVTVVGGGITRTISVTQSGATVNSLTVSPTSLSVASAAGSSTITITSNTSWTVSDDQTWITTSVTSGANNGSFSVTVIANTGTTNRNGVVTVAGGGISRTISVTQSGVGVTNFTITASAGTGGTITPSGSISVASGGSATFTIAASSGNVIDNVLVNGASVGAVATYTFSNVTANQSIAASFRTTGGGSCLLTRFGVPRGTALPTTSSNSSFNKIYTFGTAVPNLSNVTTTVINWDLPNKGLWQFSFNTNNGVPSWWIDMRSSVQNFAQPQPAISFSGLGIANLDGNSYYANVDGTNIVLVEKTGKHAIYFSNSTTAPAGCGTIAANARTSADSPVRVSSEIQSLKFPNPVFENQVTVEVPENYTNRQIHVQVLTLTGGVSHTHSIDVEGNSFLMDVSNLTSGGYIMRVSTSGQKSLSSMMLISK